MKAGLICHNIINKNTCPMNPANICSVLTTENMKCVLQRLQRIERMYNKLSMYNYLQNSLSNTNIIIDTKYQNYFKNFYVVKRDDKWCNDFFSILEREKDNDTILFLKILHEIFKKTGRVEASYSSKLVATINPNLPVWDRFVLKNLGLQKPSYNPNSETRIMACCNIYSNIETLSKIAIQQDCFIQWKKSFDKFFPQFKHFTDTKKLDLFLWQLR